MTKMNAVLMGTCFTVALAINFATSSARAAGTPCKDIESACTNAGFKKGGVSSGTGLWADCVTPIMKGTAQPAKATIKLPTVDASTIAACKTAHPNFGQHKSK